MCNSRYTTGHCVGTFTPLLFINQKPQNYEVHASQRYITSTIFVFFMLTNERSVIPPRIYSMAIFVASSRERAKIPTIYLVVFSLLSSSIKMLSIVAAYIAWSSLSLLLTNSISLGSCLIATTSFSLLYHCIAFNSASEKRLIFSTRIFSTICCRYLSCQRRLFCLILRKTYLNTLYVKK